MFGLLSELEWRARHIADSLTAAIHSCIDSKEVELYEWQLSNSQQPPMQTP